MTRPQGYIRAAEEQLFWLFTLCIPHLQTLLFAGITGLLSTLLLTLLLCFLIARSPAIVRILATRFKHLPATWLALFTDRRDHSRATHLLITASGPSLTPGFQRPPPLSS